MHLLAANSPGDSSVERCSEGWVAFVVNPQRGHNGHGRYTIMGVVRDVFVWIEIVFIIVDPVVVRRSVVVIHVRCLCRVLLPCCGVLRFLALALKQETKDTPSGQQQGKLQMVWVPPSYATRLCWGG